MIRRVLSWCRGLAKDVRRGDAVSLAWREAQYRHDDTRGVDLPTWRSPRELAAMRRIERRRGRQLVKRA
jgi:hypothetical protein